MAHLFGDESQEIIFDEDDWKYSVDFDRDNLIITPFSNEGLAIAFCKVPLRDLAEKLEPFLREFGH